MRAVFASLFVFALVAFSLAPSAQALSENEINRFAASMPDVRGWVELRSDELEETDADLIAAFKIGLFKDPTQHLLTILDGPVSYSVEQMSGSPLQSELATVVGAHGYSSSGEWAVVGDRIIKAYAALRLKGKEHRVAEAIQAVDEIKQNPDLSDAEKRQMLEMMDGVLGLARIISDVPDQDIEAVRSHKTVLKRAFRR